MKSILKKLHTDHKNFIKLLAFLELQSKLMKECKHPDYELILKAIQYMKEYPDLVHHPLEDVVFNYFLEHHQVVHDKLNALLNEHKEMPELTEQLLEKLQSVISGFPQNRKELCNELNVYIDRQKQHMNYEEGSVYPVIKLKMTDTDWKNIKSDLSKINDPLFGGIVEKNYQSLLDQVII